MHKLLLLFFSTLIIFVSCNKELKSIQKMELFFQDDTNKLCLDENIDVIKSSMNGDCKEEYILKKEGQESSWDTIILKYPTIEIYYMRGFPEVFMLSVNNSEYKSGTGVKVGDSINKILKNYKDIEKYQDFYMQYLIDDEIGKGFVYKINNKGKISEIQLAIFVD